MKTMLYVRWGGAQAAQDASGTWWVRYRQRIRNKGNVMSRWAPYAGIGKPKGYTASREVDINFPEVCCND